MLMYGSPPLPIRILYIKHCHIRSMGADFLHYQILKFKDILDKFVFRGFNGSFLHSFVYHQKYILFRNACCILIRVNTDQTKNCVGRCGKKKDQRCTDKRNKAENRGNIQCNSFRMYLRKPLRYQFSKNNTDVR